MNVISDPKTKVNNKETPSLPITTGQVVSADGTMIGYHQVGSGPGLVVLHGGIRAGHHYLRMAGALADMYTVYMPDRRGRGLSGTVGTGYSIDKEMEDVSAVLQATGARNLFGHSAGGFFALEAALRLPVETLVLYEPAVSIHGSISFDWLPAYEKALDRNDPAMAFILLAKGLQLGWISSLPNWVLVPMARQMLRSAEGQEMPSLLRTGVWEMREFERLDQLGYTYERYAAISAKTLLFSGSNSPAYLRLAARELSHTIPAAEWVELGGLDHNAPDQNAPERVAAELKRFFDQV